MAKLFDVVEPVSKQPKDVTTKFRDIVFTILLTGLSSLIIFVFINREKERENKNMENLVGLLNMDNGSILTQKVKYTTFEKTDPEDTSDVFFEVVNPGESKYEVGDLIKYSHRFFNEQGLESKKYCVIKEDQIDFHLKKKDVKDSLLKR